MIFFFKRGPYRKHESSFSLPRLAGYQAGSCCDVKRRSMVLLSTEKLEQWKTTRPTPPHCFVSPARSLAQTRRRDCISFPTSASYFHAMFTSYSCFITHTHNTHHSLVFTSIAMPTNVACFIRLRVLNVEEHWEEKRKVDISNAISIFDVINRMISFVFIFFLNLFDSVARFILI